MFHDGWTDAFDTPWCPAVSTTLPETDHVLPDVGEGFVGDEPLDDDPPPHAAAQASAIAVAVDPRRRCILVTVTAEFASNTPTIALGVDECSRHDVSTDVLAPCTVSHTHSQQTAEPLCAPAL